MFGEKNWKIFCQFIIKQYLHKKKIFKKNTKKKEMTWTEKKLFVDVENDYVCIWIKFN